VFHRRARQLSSGLAASTTQSRLGRGRSPGGLLLMASPLLFVVGLGAIRLAFGGWDAMSPDHARYIYAGMSVLADRGYVNEAGGPFLVRAPAYPLLVGAAYRLAGSGGAHLIAWLLGVGGLILAVGLAARIGGWLAGLATALTLVALPIFWPQLVTIGVDMPLAGLYLAAIGLILRPTHLRWLAAGATLGIAVLVKETVAPAAALLPLAWLPPLSTLTWRRWTGLTVSFWAAVVVVASWWWVFVWRETGMIFPLNSLAAIVRDEEPAMTAGRPLFLAIAVVGVAAWALVTVRRRADPAIRVIAAAGLALAPTVIATLALDQAIRNLSGLVTLGSIGFGVAMADVVELARIRWGPARGRILAAGLIGILFAAALGGQVAVTPAQDDPLPGQIAELARRAVDSREAVVSTFRYRSALGVELFDSRISVRLIPIAVVSRAGDPDRFLWLGERRGTLFGLSRAGWERSLGSRRASYLVVARPHALSPSELLPALISATGRDLGLAHLGELRGPEGRADVFDVDPDRIAAPVALRLHAQPAALVHWLDLASEFGEDGAERRLVDVRPVVLPRSPELAELAERLGRRACFRREREGGIAVLAIEPAAGQEDCLSLTALSE
jgi:hypothetical protein